MKRLYQKYAIDLVLWVAATPLAFMIRLEENWLNYSEGLVILLLVGLPLKSTVLVWMGFHRTAWRKVGVRDLNVLIKGVAIASLALGGVVFLLDSVDVPRSVLAIESMVALLALSMVRLSARMHRESVGRNGRKEEAHRVLIVGAGESGTMIAREMMRHPEAGLEPVGFLDDDPSKQRQRFLQLPVFGGIDALPEVLAKHTIHEVVIAMPSESGEVVRRVVKLAQESKIPHRIIPGIYELLNGSVSISQLRPVNVEDLLRREPVQLNEDDIRAFVPGRRVLVTGAGGSIGSEIVRQIMAFGPEAVVLLGRGENSIYGVLGECKQKWPEAAFYPVIADVRDENKLAWVFERFRPDLVFHAAAHKHVPLMEAHPDEAVLNNVGGTHNLVQLALAHNVERFVNISTDKAVNPTSIMGASKRLAEYVVQAASEQARPGQAFVSVRFGNVLGSRGSVIPLFKKLIEQRRPLTVTHPDMKRYFMSIPEASQLVLQAAGLGENGSVYVLDMGEPVKIVDLARDLIMLSGLEPEVDIPIRFTGIRPGEKLFEELLTAEEGTDASQHDKIFVARKGPNTNRDFELLLDQLFAAAQRHDAETIRALFCRLIPTHMLNAASGGDGEVQEADLVLEERA